MTAIPHVQCDRCKKPVDERVQEEDDFNRSIRFIVRCHGETERCEISRFDLERGVTIVEAVAFRVVPALSR